MTRCLIPYYRVSTDDKGQRPERQAEVCQPWAEREGFVLLGEEIDNGTSASKVLALDRDKFVKACERAKAARAEGVLLEDPSRFSRMDPFRAIWEVVEVKDRYGLEVYFASDSLASQATFAGKIVIFLKFALAHEWVLSHTAKVESGMRLSQLRGVKFGRKPKDETFTEDDWLFIEEQRAKGVGYDSVALMLNERRGVNTMTDRAKAKRLGITKSSLRRAIERRRAAMDQSPPPSEMQNETEGVPADGNGVDSDGAA